VLTRLTALTADLIDHVDVVDGESQRGQPRQHGPQVNTVNAVIKVNVVQNRCVRRRRT
jgi:hypothetical protein